MEILKFGFLTLRLLDVIDIILFAFLVYQLYSLVRGSVAVNILLGLLLIYLIWLIVRALDMKLLAGILGQFIGVGVLALIIVFQQEIRRFLLLVGKQSILKSRNRWLKLFPWNWALVKHETPDYETIVEACKNLSNNKVGAIIVIARTTELRYFASTGEEINANITSGLIETIFSKNSPMHDGAVIIAENKIKAAKCIMPLTEKTDLPAHFGLRHRAGIGITEQSDASAIIVSEENGSISFAERGRIKYNITCEELKNMIIALEAGK